MVEDRAAVEAQLAALQRRANSILLLNLIFVFASALVVVVTALVIAAIGAGPAAFRWLAAAGFGAAIATAAACAAWARRRWLSLAAAAAMAERTTELRQRLITFVSLTAEQRNQSLFSLLSSQLIELAPGWRPERVLPRRVPIPAFVLVASVLLSLGALWLLRPEPSPLQSEATSQEQKKEEPPLRASLPREAKRSNSPLGARIDWLGQQTADDSPSAADSADEGEQLAAAAGDARRPADDGTELLPDRLRRAIRSALGSADEHPDAASAARPAGQRAEGRQLADNRAAGHQPQGGPASPQAAQRVAGKDAEGSGQRLRERGDGARAELQRGEGNRQQGGAPSAGAEPGAGRLLAAERGADDLQAPGSFKVTLTTFLEQTGGSLEPQRQARAAGAAAYDSDWSVSEQQQQDDLLLRAEVPPQLEDVVRRVYARSAGEEWTMPEREGMR